MLAYGYSVRSEKKPVVAKNHRAKPDVSILAAAAAPLSATGQSDSREFSPLAGDEMATAQTILKQSTLFFQR